MLTARELPSDEWDRLEGTELESVSGLMRPECTRVLVVEDDETGEIVGCWALLTALHVEGYWVDPEHRQSAGVFRKLLRVMREWITEAGTETVITGASDPLIEAYLERLGAHEMPCKSFLWQMKES